MIPKAEWSDAMERADVKKLIKLLGAFEPTSDAWLVPKLPGLADHPSWGLRSRALEALFKALHRAEPHQLAGILLAHLDDDSSLVRSECAEALGDLRWKPATAVLCRAFSRERDEIARMSIVTALAQLGVESALPTVLLALQDPDDLVRDYALEAVGHLAAVGTAAVRSEI